MKDIQQLIKKNSQEGRYEDIFPKTFIDAVVNRETGVSLDEILNGFNMYFLTYLGGSGVTRLQVPNELRRQGLFITYVLFDKTTVIEWYDSDNISDEAWQSDTNWKAGSVSDIWKNYRGYSEERPLLTLVDDGFPFYDRTLLKYICWNGLEWVNIDGSSLT